MRNKSCNLRVSKHGLFRVPDVLGDRGVSQTAVKKLVVNMTPCAVGMTCSCLTQLVST